jgi:hypothetical protein
MEDEDTKKLKEAKLADRKSLSKDKKVTRNQYYEFVVVFAEK